MSDFSRRSFFGLLVAGAFAALGVSASEAEAQVVIYRDRHAPPPLRFEARPMPRRGWDWRPGHWAWRRRGWVWVPGHWTRDRFYR
jgi:hypothetical protein